MQESNARNTKDKLPNRENFEKAIAFVKKNLKYFAAGALFVVLLLLLVRFGAPKNVPNVVEVEGTAVVEKVEEPYQVDAYPEINQLITQYYAAYAAGDIATLQTLAAPISEKEQSYIPVYSQYIEEFQNVKCYTKSGL
ncbi:MAG: SH3 domain-containing protein, partial [Clostridiales bacterium]|nr:SH3 domain-containing protein [Clostridiales bacterium]